MWTPPRTKQNQYYETANVPIRSLYVAPIGSVTKCQIHDHFSSYGEVESVRLRSANNNNFKYAFVQFKTPDSARKVLLRPNHIIGLQIVKVKVAFKQPITHQRTSKTESPRTATPPKREKPRDPTPPKKRNPRDPTPPRREKPRDPTPPKREKPRDPTPPRRRNARDPTPPKRGKPRDPTPPKREKPRGANSDGRSAPKSALGLHVLAENKKNAGNDQFKAKNYSSAIGLYSEAIDLCPYNATYYGNRSACLLMMGDYKGALKDSREAVQIDSKFVKGYDRMIKCYISLGDIFAAEQTIKKLAEFRSNGAPCKLYEKQCIQLRTLTEKMLQCYEIKDFKTAYSHAEAALIMSPECWKFKFLKAECLALTGRIAEADGLAASFMKLDPFSADAIYVHGLCLYYQDNLDQGLTQFQRALTLDPDYSKAKVMRLRAKHLKEKKENGNKLYKMGKFREAHKMYTEALEIDPLNTEVNSKLWYNRALMNSKLAKTDDAIDDCIKALKINPSYLKVILLRAQCYYDLRDYEECIRDCEAAMKIDDTLDIKKLLELAKAALKKPKRKEYYGILGIDRHASTAEIKKAYRKCAMAHHPDRHANASEYKKYTHEKKFKEIGEAYAVLSDPKKKYRFDNGFDLGDDIFDS